MRFKSVTFMGLVLSAGLLTSNIARSAPPPIDIEAKDAWIRWLPADLPAAGYMTLINEGSEAQILIGAASADYAQVGFHQTRNNNGMSEMTQVPSISLEPQKPVHFAEGGYHLMLMQPKRSIHPGDVVTITLRFADGRTIAIPFSVKTMEPRD